MGLTASRLRGLLFPPPQGPTSAASIEASDAESSVPPSLPATTSSPTTQNTFISSLPPELLLTVLEYAAEIPSDSANPGRCFDLLLATTSISRAWKHPSQVLLWRNICCYTRDQASRLLESPVLGKFSAYRLEMWGTVDSARPVVWQRPQRQQINDILSRLVVVQELSFWSCVVDTEVLAYPTLTRVKTCRFGYGSFFSEESAAQVTPSCHFTRIDIHGSPSNSGGLLPVFSASSSTLTSLTLRRVDLYNREALTQLSLSLSLVSGAVQHLRLAPATESTLPLLSTFTHLSSLSLGLTLPSLSVLGTMLSSLNSTPTYLCLRAKNLVTPELTAIYIPILLRFLHLPVLSKLKSMELMNEKGSYRRTGDLKGLRTLCASKGVELLLTL